MDNIHKNIEKQNPNEKRKILIAFEVVEVFSNKKLNSVVSELIIRGRKLNIYFVLIRNHVLKYQEMLTLPIFLS